MAQIEGIPGKLVLSMIQRSLRSRFRNIYWKCPSEKPVQPAILACNHHNWFDGYIMLQAAIALDLEVVDWIQEFDAFPLFRYVGGMPFPLGDQARRLGTIRKTIELMQSGEKSLLIFPESHLHPAPELLSFGSAATKIAGKVDGTTVFPVGIHYEFSMHERPEAFVCVGEPVSDRSQESIRAAVAVELEKARVVAKAGNKEGWPVLFKGTPDVNERWDFRAKFGRKG